MKTLNVCNIQRFSTGDGPGIRTTVFLKGCPMRCPWCHNPETQSPLKQTLHFKAADKTVSYGAEAAAEEIARDVCEDIEFYKESGGGVTVSGGEPMLQADGVAELARILRGRGVSTLIDTAGFVPWSSFETVLPEVNEYYYDVKSGSAEKYTMIGGVLEVISDNLKRLIRAGADVTVRIPFIPGFNSSEEDIKRICEVVTGAGADRAYLLPFHRLGASKYEALGIDYAYKDIKPPDAETVVAAAEIYRRFIGVDFE